MSNIERIDVGPRMSEIVVHNGVAYLSGQLASDPGGDIGAQTREVLALIDGLLARVGSDRSRLLTASIWLRSMDDLAGMNAAWEAWLPAGAAPARATVEAAMVAPAFRVEIAVTAAV